MSISVLGVRIDQVTIQEARKKIEFFLHSQKRHTIWTPNPEMLVAAWQLPAFRAVLNRSDLNVCDGSGISLLSRGKVHRIHGSDFIIDICAIAQKECATVLLLGGYDQTILDAAVSVLNAQFPKLRIVGAYTGPQLDKNGTVLSQEENDKILAHIRQAQPDIIFVGFGHIKQEMWITKYAPQLPHIRIAMGVGGSFDMLAGKTPRAPILIRWLHLEWLWRLLLDPRRFKRIWTAVILFPLLYIYNAVFYETHQ